MKPPMRAAGTGGIMRHAPPKLNPEIARDLAAIQYDMLTHMKRTTLLIDTALYAELKRRAATEQRTLTEVVERALRAGLRTPRGRTTRRSIPSYDLGPFLEDPTRRGDAEPGRPGEDGR